MAQIKLPRQFDTEEKCIGFLEALRWPEGVCCPKCASDRISRFQASGKTGKLRQLYQCLGCRYQFSVRSGTIFHDSHLPLQKWFTAMALIGESGGAVSANQLRQVLGVQYKTAWQLSNRLREAMQQSVEQTMHEAAEASVDTEQAVRNGHAAWERQVFIRFLEGAGRAGATAIAPPHEAERAASSLPARSRIPQIGIAATPLPPATQQPKRSAAGFNGKHTLLPGPVDSLVNFWRREVFDSFPVVGARHIPGYVNEVTYLFGKLFLSALPSGLLCPVGQEIKRSVAAPPLRAAAAKVAK